MQSSWEVKQPFGNLFKLLITLFIIVVIPLIALTAWVNWALAAPSKDNQKKTFVIGEGESPASFSGHLQEEGIIRHAFTFRVYLKLSGLDRKVQAGSFNLPTNEPASEIALALTNGRLDKWVTFVEGLRKEQVAAILEEDFNINKDKFLVKAPEGYLFPDKYLIPLKTNDDQVLSIFKANFDKKFNKNSQEEAVKENLTVEQVITMASIVERETKNTDERPIIAGILLRRLREGMLLGVDATVQYALGYFQEEKTWWRKNITAEDLKIDSPYNTRINLGLPPGPICSPGLSSINAVLNPTDSPYYFYLHDKEGKAHYARTLQEHLQNIQKYLSS
jgi:UPF0755 protein